MLGGWRCDGRCGHLRRENLTFVVFADGLTETVAPQGEFAFGQSQHVRVGAISATGLA